MACGVYSPQKEVGSASRDQVVWKCQQGHNGVTFYDTSGLKRNVWHAANGILVSYLMSSTSTLSQGGIRIWSGAILILEVSQGQSSVQSFAFRRNTLLCMGPVSPLIPIIMVPAWHPVGTEVLSSGRGQVLITQVGPCSEIFTCYIIQPLISAPPFHWRTNNIMFPRRNQSGRRFTRRKQLEVLAGALVSPPHQLLLAFLTALYSWSFMDQICNHRTLKTAKLVSLCLSSSPVFSPNKHLTK